MWRATRQWVARLPLQVLGDRFSAHACSSTLLRACMHACVHAWTSLLDWIFVNCRARHCRHAAPKEQHGAGAEAAGRQRHRHGQDQVPAVVSLGLPACNLHRFSTCCNGRQAGMA